MLKKIKIHLINMIDTNFWAFFSCKNGNSIVRSFKYSMKTSLKVIISLVVIAVIAVGSIVIHSLMKKDKNETGLTWTEKSSANIDQILTGTKSFSDAFSKEKIYDEILKIINYEFWLTLTMLLDGFINDFRKYVLPGLHSESSPEKIFQKLTNFLKSYDFGSLLI